MSDPEKGIIGSPRGEDNLAPGEVGGKVIAHTTDEALKLLGEREADEEAFASYGDDGDDFEDEDLDDTSDLDDEDEE